MAAKKKQSSAQKVPKCRWEDKGNNRGRCVRECDLRYEDPIERLDRGKVTKRCIPKRMDGKERLFKKRVAPDDPSSLSESSRNVYESTHLRQVSGDEKKKGNLLAQQLPPPKKTAKGSTSSLSAPIPTPTQQEVDKWIRERMLPRYKEAVFEDFKNAPLTNKQELRDELTADDLTLVPGPASSWARGEVPTPVDLAAFKRYFSFFH